MDLPNTPSEFCHGSFWSRGSTWVVQKTRPPSIPEFWNCLWTTCMTRWYLNVDPNFKKNKPLQSEVFELFQISLWIFLSPKNPCPQLVPRHLSHLTLLLPLPSHLPLTSSPLPSGHGFGSGAGGAWMGAGGVVLAQWEKVSEKILQRGRVFYETNKTTKGNTKHHHLYLIYKIHKALTFNNFSNPFGCCSSGNSSITSVSTTISVVAVVLGAAGGGLGKPSKICWACSAV